MISDSFIIINLIEPLERSSINRLYWDFFVCNTENNKWSSTCTCNTLESNSTSRSNYDSSINKNITILRKNCCCSYECTHIKYRTKDSRSRSKCRTCKCTTYTTRESNLRTRRGNFSSCCWHCVLCCDLSKCDITCTKSS